MVTHTNNCPKLHDAAWPGLVGKGPDSELPIEVASSPTRKLVSDDRMIVWVKEDRGNNMLTIALPIETENRLKGEASRHGLDVSDYARQLIETALFKPKVDQVTIDLLDRWEREQATDDPEEIARRQKEFEEFKEGMNRNRLEMEGPDSRKIYP
jgi:hypothetical protein